MRNSSLYLDSAGTGKGKYLAGLGGGTSWVGLLFTGRLILASRAPLHFPTTPSLPKASLKC